MSTEWVQYLGMWATSIMAVVTGGMALWTARMARATQHMAEAASRQLEFMRDEADQQARAAVQLFVGDANGRITYDAPTYGNEVTVDLRYCNTGPSHARRPAIYGWLCVKGGEPSFAYHPHERDVLWCEEGGETQLRFEFGSGAEDVQVAAQAGMRADLTVLASWRDERQRFWASVVRVAYQWEDSKGPGSPECACYWPDGPGSAALLARGDALIQPGLAPAALLVEVERRLLDEAPPV